MQVIRHRAFTLVELLVAIAIIGMLLAILLPAVMQVRSATRRISCANNLRQLSLGCLDYAEAHGKLPFARKYDVWDTYTWTQLILSRVERSDVHDGYTTLYDRGLKEQMKRKNNAPYPGPNGPPGDDEGLRTARHTEVGLFCCPSDEYAGTGNELDSPLWGFIRGSYRGCVGSGDMYGESVDSTEGPWGAGAFGVAKGKSYDVGSLPGTRLVTIGDGLSRTLMLSEGLAPSTRIWGGPIGSTVYGNMGGSLFSAATTPNSTSPDRVVGPCPQDQGDVTYTAPCLTLGANTWWTPSAEGAYVAARSAHANGVNASFVDGSVHFTNDDIDLDVWRSLATSDGGESVAFQKP